MRGDANSAKVPHPDSLYHRCAARQYVKGRATVFVMCTALPGEVPAAVVRCEAFQPRSDDPD